MGVMVIALWAVEVLDCAGGTSGMDSAGSGSACGSDQRGRIFRPWLSAS